MELDLRHVVSSARRWLWLLALLPLMVAGVGRFLASQQAPLYSATATLLINPAQPLSADAAAAVRGGQDLAATYTQLVVTRPVLEPVAQTLGEPFTAGVLSGRLSASVVADTALMRITAVDNDPVVAALIANTTANQFAVFIAAQTSEQTTTSRAALQQLVESTEGQIRDSNSRIEVLEGQAASDARDAELIALRSRLNQLQTTYADLLVKVQQLDLSSATASTQVKVSVPAIPSGGPFAPRVDYVTVVGLFIGLVLAVVTIALVEYLDNTVKVTSNFQALLGAPLMAVVGAIQKLSPGRDQLFVITQPKTNNAEAIRLLRTNIEFAAATREIARLTVTSAQQGEGKSTITANLAVAMAQAGFRTVVVDADLRRPSQHRIFEVRNDRGLSTLLTRSEMSWKSAATAMLDGRLHVLTTRPLPPNPADLLSSDRFRELIDDIGRQVDVVLIDTPPVLAVSDPLIVANATDGVLLVTRAGKTRLDAFERAVTTFPESVRKVGVVLNQQERRGGEGYYYYYYSSGYYGSDTPSQDGSDSDQAPPPSNIRELKPVLDKE